MKNPNIIESVLDNPVWNALHQIHKNFCSTEKTVKFYNPVYCPFGAISNKEQSVEDIATYASVAKDFFVVGEQPELPSGVALKNELICEQMIVRQPIEMTYTEEVVKLEESLHQALYDLVNLVQPGYFRIKTPLLGEYYGIFKDGKLVAVTGERMRMDDFTEISAVVTHPDYTGKGLAKQLVAYVSNKVFTEGKTPFLHVTHNNLGAIGLYLKLGYVSRRKMSFWHLVKE